MKKATLVVGILGLFATILSGLFSNSALFHPRPEPQSASEIYHPVSIDFAKATEYGLTVMPHEWNVNRSEFNPSETNYTLFLFRDGPDPYSDTSNSYIICYMKSFPPVGAGDWESVDFPDSQHFRSSGAWEVSGQEGNILDFIKYSEEVLKSDPLCDETITELVWGFGLSFPSTPIP